jgi:hypothetical protein
MVLGMQEMVAACGARSGGMYVVMVEVLHTMCTEGT